MDVLYEQYMRCEQENWSMEAYTEEFLWFSTHVEISKRESGCILRYKGGLKLIIQKKLGLQQIESLDEASNLALQAERQLEKMRTKWQYGESNSH